MADEETFVNPQPPPNYRVEHHKDDNSSQPLTNADFRKLLMTPAASSTHAASVAASVRSKDIAALKLKKSKNESSEKRKEKKLYYASLMKEAKEREAELAKKYRDRAKERRDNHTDTDQFVSTTANFRAVAPDAKIGDNAERRRQIIEESKYLGGDLEHTHLVKGLDYALLQKVKAELDNEQNDDDDDDEEREIKKKTLAELDADEQEQDDEDEPELPKQMKQPSKQVKPQIKNEKAEEIESNNDENKITFNTKLARNISRIAFTKIEIPKVNELFLPKRMAYVMDLDDEETDIPITLIRSKADCPNKEMNSSLTTNDIVINKLIQILAYLRQGGKKDSKKIKKKLSKLDEELQQQQKKEGLDFGIYDDVGDYVPDLNKRTEIARRLMAGAESSKDEEKKKGYFGFKEDYDKHEKEEDEQVPTKETAHAFIKNISDKYTKSQPKEADKKEEKDEKEKDKSKMALKFASDSYAECYPGTIAEEDVNVDSDDEPDYEKMDLGNKKGPVNRWDFDTNEEYSNYMSNKEAMPKAAFQYGLKMQYGRKTRRVATDQKQEKQKIDKEWQQISKILEKRKAGEGSSNYKKPKY